MAAITGMTLLLAACGGGSSADDTHPSASSAATATEQILPKVDEPPPTARSLVGTWSRTGGVLTARFRREGTFALDEDPHTLDAAYAAGTYEFDGRRITFTSKGSQACVEGETWVWETGITEGEDPLDDEIHIVFLEDGCGLTAGTDWRFARLALE
jgi:hypothetical protein